MENLRKEAKSLGVKACSKMSKDELISIIGVFKGANIILKMKLSRLLVIIAPYEHFTFSEDAYTIILNFTCKLTTGIVIPRYLGDAAKDYVGHGIFRDKIEYVLIELISLAVNEVREKRGGNIITKANIISVSKNDEDIALIF